jgi:hypothetical protein
LLELLFYSVKQLRQQSYALLQLLALAQQLFYYVKHEHRLKIPCSCQAKRSFARRSKARAAKKLMLYVVKPKDSS